jgi:hypothetical protein
MKAMKANTTAAPTKTYSMVITFDFCIVYLTQARLWNKSYDLKVNKKFLIRSKDMSRTFKLCRMGLCPV